MHLQSGAPHMHGEVCRVPGGHLHDGSGAVSATIVFAAGTFRSYNIRATAWNIVLLPATRSEKFVAHYIYACLFVPLIFIAAYLAGIALSYASSYVFGNEAIDLVTAAS